jgi:hypothetical protein
LGTAVVSENTGQEVEHAKPPPLPPRDAADRLTVLVAVGLCLLLLAVSLLFPLYDRDFERFRVLLVPAAISLGAAAVGLQLAVQMKWVSAAGAAGLILAYGLFVKPDPPRPPAPVTPYVFGSISARGSQTVVIQAGDQRFITGRNSAEDPWLFFARAGVLASRKFSISIRVRGELLEFGCIDIDLLHRRASSPGGLEVSLRSIRAEDQSETWVLVEPGTGERLGTFGNTECPVTSGMPFNTASRMAWPTTVFRVANAQSPWTSLFDQLASQDLDEVFKARDEIASMRDQARIRDLANAWSPGARMRLDANLVTAWVSAIRRNRAVAVPIAAGLDERKLSHIVNLMGHPDLSVRVNASELMAWLLQTTGPDWSSGTRQPQAGLILDVSLRPLEDPKGFETLVSVEVFRSALFNLTRILGATKCRLDIASQNRVQRAFSMFEESQFARDPGLALTSQSVRLARQARC